MNLLSKEAELLKSDNDKIILTTHRIRKTDKDWGLLYQIEFFLEDISSVELRAQSVPLLLGLAGLCFVLGIYLGVSGSARGASGEGLAILFVSGVLLLLLWLGSRQRVIKITSNCGKSIGIDVRKLTAERAQEFLDRVQVAKSSRMDYLSRNEVRPASN